MGNPDPLAGPFGCKPCNPRLDASPIYMTHSIINLNWSKICQICLVFTDLVIVAIFVGFSVPGFRVGNFFLCFADELKIVTASVRLSRLLRKRLREHQKKYQIYIRK